MTPLRLLHVTDLHLSADEQATLRGVQPLPALRCTLAQARSLSRSAGWAPDVILVTGDIVHDDPGGYDAFSREFAGLGVPVCCIPGNHDDAAVLSQRLADAPFVTSGCLDLKGWRLVLLDTSVPGQDGGHLAPAQLQWLEESLAAATTPVLVCLHHHPVPMGSDWLDRIGLDNAGEFFRLIDASRSVRGILWGHVHQQFDGLRRGVRLLATPSTCTQFLPHAVDFAVDSRPPAFRTLDLAVDGSLLTDLHWVDPCGTGSSRSASSAA
ncbi:MAG TPA: phosphodiesterase [Steroidobacteraceae bacterium]|nr:phosphodiesterase [Steroidobacteraceae bacterium]